MVITQPLASHHLTEFNIDQTKKGGAPTQSRRNGIWEKLKAHRASLHPIKRANFDKRLHDTLNAASASSDVADATERFQEAPCRIIVVQRWNVQHTELQYQNERHLANLAEDPQTPKKGSWRTHTLQLHSSEMLRQRVFIISKIMTVLAPSCGLVARQMGDLKNGFAQSL